ncbi:MAG TPA: TolC family protein [Rubrivivax sp.]|nr:TolC family protein [Rubrivivax sp.]HRY89251.1 TolC family protein [Rubrivivax sp.]HRZ61591.1 TolC family protein [Rubrivivax sp.]
MPPTSIAPSSRAAALVALLLLAGCVNYHPQPLAGEPTAAHELRQLALPAQALSLPDLAPHAIDLAQPLDMTTVAMLAVAGNPDLELARADAGIAHAQAFAAGLLPDPQFSLARDYPGSPGYFSAFNAGLSFDLGSLITLSARRDAARADRHKADLALLWQEWQVVAQARKLFVGISILERSCALLEQGEVLTRYRLDLARLALADGNLTIDAVSPFQLAQADARRQLDEQTRQLHQARAALNVLLGLAPEVRLALAPLQPPIPIDDGAVRRALAHLATRRPDLLALSAGYEAQEARLRAAVLAQFPSINVGFARARDTSLVYTSGFTLSLSVPIFNGSLGTIAVETATRRRMHDEYLNRVNAAHAEVAQILDDQALLRSQLASTHDTVEALARTAQAADLAYAARQMTVANYVDLQSALLARRIDELALERAAFEQQVALQTLLGGELPQPGAGLAGARSRPIEEKK